MFLPILFYVNIIDVCNTIHNNMGIRGVSKSNTISDNIVVGHGVVKCCIQYLTDAIEWFQEISKI